MEESDLVDCELSLEIGRGASSVSRLCFLVNLLVRQSGQNLERKRFFVCDSVHDCFSAGVSSSFFCLLSCDSL